MGGDEGRRGVEMGVGRVSRMGREGALRDYNALGAEAGAAEGDTKCELARCPPWAHGRQVCGEGGGNPMSVRV